MADNKNQPDKEDRSFLAGLRAPLHHKELFARNVVALSILTILTSFGAALFWRWPYPRNLDGCFPMLYLVWCVIMFVKLFRGRAKAKKAEKKLEAIISIWPFPDANNATVITSKRIATGKDWIYCVCHDAEDGEWQFHPYSGYVKEEETSTVDLETIAKQEPRILELYDLPLGWHAWRDKREEEWQRAPQNQ